MIGNSAKGMVWKGWGPRFRRHCRENHTSLAKIAGLIGRGESTLRSWTNGTREINLSEFFALCAAAKADPAAILFDITNLTPHEREQISAMLGKILEFSTVPGPAPDQHRPKSRPPRR